MNPERRRLAVLLGILSLVSLLALYQYWPSVTPSASRSEAVGSASGGAGASLQAPDVRLGALSEARPAPDEAAGRNLFRYQSTRVAPASNAPQGHGPVQREERPPEAPRAVPTVPPIALRFIGLVEAPEHADRIAILSDGRGVYQGREGDIIEGRYRILHIGGESIDMVYLDGRGRQTIRLSGS